MTDRNLTAIYQYGYAIFGVGADLDAALADASRWTDEPIDEDDLSAHSARVCGSMVEIEITPRLAAAVARHGGDVPMTEITRGVYDLDTPQSAD